MRTAESTVSTEGGLTVLTLDLTSLRSVREFVKAFKATGLGLDVLIMNAAVMNGTRDESDDGYELHFAVNVLGHFLLAKLLLPMLEKAPAGRIVMVGSSTHHLCSGLDFDDLQTERDFSMFKAYSRSKLANVMVALQLQRRLEAKKSKVTCNVTNPGLVLTDISRNMKWFMRAGDALSKPVMMVLRKQPRHGAFTIVYAASSPELASEGGQYFSNCLVQKYNPVAGDVEACERLWEECEDLVSDKKKK